MDSQAHSQSRICGAGANSYPTARNLKKKLIQHQQWQKSAMFSPTYNRRPTSAQAHKGQAELLSLPMRQARTAAAVHSDTDAHVGHCRSSLGFAAHAATYFAVYLPSFSLARDVRRRQLRWSHLSWLSDRQTFDLAGKRL